MFLLWKLRPFIQFHGPDVTFMHDNARPHLAAIMGSFWRQIVTMSWTDLRIVPTLIPSGLDKLGRRVQRSHAIHTVNDLAAALQAEWANLPAPFIQRYVNGMRRRITACIAQNGGHMRY